MLHHKNTGPIKPKHWGFAAGVFVAAVVIGLAVDAFGKPRYTKPSSTQEAERIIENALKYRTPGHRWEVVDVTVSSCMVRIFTHDKECTSPTMLQSFETVYDLRKMSLAIEFSDPFVGVTGRVQFVDVSPRREFEVQFRHIQERSRQLIDEARKEVGWGPDAAVLKSERFAAEFSEADLPAWDRTHVCNDDVYFDVHDRNLIFQLPNLDKRDELLGAAQVLEAHCAASAVE